ncbi:neuropeptide Y receptor type 2-like [Saccoglossus kowalevskii]
MTEPSFSEPEPMSELQAEPEPLSNGSSLAEPSMEVGVQVFLVIIAVIIVIVGIVGNVLVIVVMGSIKTGRTVTDIFLASLAVADVIVCVVCVPLLIVGITTHEGHTGLSYNVEQFLFYFATMSSILNLTTIAVDRHDAVLHPLSRKITIDRSKAILSIIWVASILIAVVIFTIPDQYEMVILFPGFAIPVTIMCVCYIRIVKTARIAGQKALPANQTKPKSDKTLRMLEPS